jgi:hypothetical protein
MAPQFNTGDKNGASALVLLALAPA